MKQITLFLVLFVLAIHSLEDAAFFQDTALQYTYKDTKLAQWNQLPFSSGSSIVQVTSFVGTGGEFYILTNDSLWLLTTYIVIPKLEINSHQVW